MRAGVWGWGGGGGGGREGVTESSCRRLIKVAAAMPDDEAMLCKCDAAMLSLKIAVLKNSIVMTVVECHAAFSSLGRTPSTYL